MPRPISAIGRRVSSIDFSSDDLAAAARRQDEERQIREDDAYFERTGENRKPYVPVDPLVPINGYAPPEIADDGDDYMDSEGYSENSSSRLIDPDAPGSLTNSSRNARTAYFDREKIKEERETSVKIEKNNKKYQNAIIGLKIR